jgi:Lrp/AsnC family transcriptional regulator for asnA, asnC and gidA
MKNDLAKPAIEINDIDLRIIEILKNDASRTFVDIAKEVDVSDATVRHRFRKMFALGIINKFTINVNNTLLGYDHLAFICIKTKPSSTDVAFLSQISEIHGVLEIHEIHGIFDLIVKVRTTSLGRLRDLLENIILKLPSITEVELMSILKTEMEKQVVSAFDKPQEI